jgi:hypothetical protein
MTALCRDGGRMDAKRDETRARSFAPRQGRAAPFLLARTVRSGRYRAARRRLVLLPQSVPRSPLCSPQAGTDCPPAPLSSRSAATAAGTPDLLTAGRVRFSAARVLPAALARACRFRPQSRDRVPPTAMRLTVTTNVVRPEFLSAFLNARAGRAPIAPRQSPDHWDVEYQRGGDQGTPDTSA